MTAKRKATLGEEVMGEMIDGLMGKLKDRSTKVKKPHLDYTRGLSTGSTLLNLACTDRPDVGLLPGHFYYLVGDSSSGKTWLTMTLFAEASINPLYKDYRFIHDNAEHGALMDLRRYFGDEMADRVEPPKGTCDDPIYSTTVEEFAYRMMDAFDADKPFIYILDSMDALDSEADVDKFEEDRKAFEKGKEASGSYGMAKAKKNSDLLRKIRNRLTKDGKSILVVISQTRANVGFGAQFNPKTRSGGKALTFYAALEIWTSVAGHKKTTYEGKPIEQGIICQARIRKGRVTGKDRTVEFPIYHSSGLDDIGGCIDYLIDWKHWEGTEKMVTAPEFSFKGHKERLIAKIQDECLEGKLRDVVSDVWKKIEEACAVPRKNPYAARTPTSQTNQS